LKDEAKINTFFFVITTEYFLNWEPTVVSGSTAHLSDKRLGLSVKEYLKIGVDSVKHQPDWMDWYFDTKDADHVYKA
jgi:hypothetical protein